MQVQRKSGVRWIRRPDTVAYDFDQTDFGVLSAWTNLDLSAIIPANAKWVRIRAIGMDESVPSTLSFGSSDEAHDYNVASLRVDYVSRRSEIQFVIPVVGQLIKYKTDNNAWSSVQVQIVGWGY